jgi:4-diphosphocytidyl-2-C-methyl-D-erythritol kinase
MAAEFHRVVRSLGRARAKINLTLHVRGRRNDGYHDLESLVVFGGVSDALAYAPVGEGGFTLTVDGATDLGPADDNLVLRAARFIAPEGRGAFRLVKNLPVASGMGGGSADAAAALRLVAGEAALTYRAEKIGADVPVCIASRARMMRGVGEALGPVLDIAPLFAVLVNPRVAVSTVDVFRALGLKPGDAFDRTPHPDLNGDVLDLLVRTRNDLEQPALAVAPIIGDVLDALREQDGLKLARMSGSGATCFGIFENRHAAVHAARALRLMHPQWWVCPTILR